MRPRPSPTSAPPVEKGPLGNELNVNGTIDLAGLSAPVDIVRDTHGVVHIYAQTHADAFRAQGYAMARDRAAQIELLRRTADGRTAQILGAVSPSTIDQDIVMRTLGLRSVAQLEWAAMNPVVRPWVEAFADGVSQWFAEIREGRAALPPAGPAWQASHFEPFSAIDALLIDKLMQFAMSWSIGQELAATQFTALVRATQHSPNPKVRQRSGMLPDLLRFAPSRPEITVESYSLDHGSSLSPRDGLPANIPMIPHLSALTPSLEAWKRAGLAFGAKGNVGTNAWAVAPLRSVSGGSVLAVDAHFRLTSPPPLWLVHLQIANAHGVDGPYVTGASLPGVPGVAYGFHRDLAWSPVASSFDVADVYVERLDATAQAVQVGNDSIPLEVRQETIAVAEGQDIVIDVRAVPHHGPIIPILVDHQVAPLQPDLGALSVRWSGLSPTRDLEFSLSLLAAEGVEHVLSQAGFAPSSVRSHVVADVDEVLYVAPTLVVRRDDRALAWDARKYEGRLPCLALPGDGTAEWVGTYALSSIPWVQRPSSGYVVTANADPVGTTLDNDPSNDRLADGSSAFFSCSFDIGFRQGRLRDKLQAAVEPITLADAISIQSDVGSDLAARLVPHWVDAVKRVQREQQKPGTYPLLTELAHSSRFATFDADHWLGLMESWEKDAQFEMRTGVTTADMSLTLDSRDALASRASLMFHAWLTRLFHNVFADEMGAMGLGMQGWLAISESLPVRTLLHLLETRAESLASYDMSLRDSLLWDDLTTDPLESRDERLVTSWLDAIDWLSEHLGDDRNRWRWGLVHTVRLAAPDPSMGLLAVPSESDRIFPNGFPRTGGLYTVDTADYSLARLGPGSPPLFAVHEGPALRLAVRFTSNGPEAAVALAGGQIADPARSYFRDGMELWRHNLTHALIYRRNEVLNQARTREVAVSRKDGSVD
ncbi:MAG TPA: penicillin acylase family protein [Polyangiaceae bacterium]|nr:penicillin acylase family protein [Polyangiaceae bacterium]HOD22178.1 penicillin acylase family protein [Polyangiaceae bacterium]HOE47374.1 penicillin acylase family protein [Polyangiaceae bacterium]HOH02483.1 penicillin acylase family protein [Polyangiaceae bacterium]HOR35811.1 penicillin acylase family protein [Polyangiaceae bacterium]